MWEYLIIVMTPFIIGYVLGLLQQPIRIEIKKKDSLLEQTEYNNSVGIQEFMEYHDQTDGANKF